jgi:hypothetical protein
MAYLTNRPGQHLKWGAPVRAYVHTGLTRARGALVFSLQQQTSEGWRVVAHLRTADEPATRGPRGLWLADVRVRVCQGRAAAARAAGKKTVNAAIEGTLMPVAPRPASTGDLPRPNGEWPDLPRLKYVNDDDGARFAVVGRDGRRLARDVSTVGRMPSVRLGTDGVSVAGWRGMVWRDALA